MSEQSSGGGGPERVADTLWHPEQAGGEDEAHQLQQELRELDRTIATLRGEDAAESDELTHASQHQADVATELSDVERQDAVIQAMVDKRERVAARLAALSGQGGEPGGAR